MTLRRRRGLIGDGATAAWAVDDVAPYELTSELTSDPTMQPSVSNNSGAVRRSEPGKCPDTGRLPVARSSISGELGSVIPVKDWWVASPTLERVAKLTTDIKEKHVERGTRTERSD